MEREFVGECRMSPGVFEQHESKQKDDNKQFS